MYWAIRKFGIPDLLISMISDFCSVVRRRFRPYTRFMVVDREWLWPIDHDVTFRFPSCRLTMK